MTAHKGLCYCHNVRSPPLLHLSLTHTSPLSSLPGVRGERGILIRVIIRTPLLNITPALCARAAAVRLFYDTWQSVRACKCQVCWVSDQRPRDRGAEQSQQSLCPVNTPPSLTKHFALAQLSVFIYPWGYCISAPVAAEHVTGRGHFSSGSDIPNAFCKLSMFSLKNILFIGYME